MNNDWLKKLYNLREKWCPTFSKDFFSAGILSSQRSESTYHALSRKISVTATLCDFYHFFCETVSEWRSHERSDNERCWEGFPEIAIPYMQRKVHKVLSSSDSNEVARALFEEAFNKLKVDVEAHVGSIHFSDTDSPHNGEVQISNPKGSRNKGERNVRRKSVKSQIIIF
ncbi:unnamed protein product [Cuscuta campestris]|uniref:Protein FAR1-RELATED SEQUENCE n=1 Tax=Cuscuta campestris TaxID=132261 RepID=A0A484LZU5_9ASTE|nr:unnamed protein product [Cuscuta campestris]